MIACAVVLIAALSTFSICVSHLQNDSYIREDSVIFIEDENAVPSVEDAIRYVE